MGEAAIIESLPEDEQLSLVTLAMLLSGDEDAGIKLLARSAVQARDHEDEIDARDYALETARRQLVRTFVADQPGRREDKIRRAAVAMHYFGDLSLAETARALELSIDLVSTEIQRADSDSHLYETWAPLLKKSPDTAVLIPEIDRQRRRFKWKRRRMGILVTLAALIMITSVIIGTVVVPRLPHPTHHPGEWTFVHSLKPSSGWTILARSIDALSETTVVTRPDRQGSKDLRCTLTLFAPGDAQERMGFDPQNLEGDTIRVDNRSGTIVRPPEYPYRVLVWRYGVDAWAQAHCSTPLEETRATLEEFLEAIQFDPSLIRVPVRLVKFPAGFEVDSVMTGLDPVGTSVYLKGEEMDEWRLVISAGRQEENGDPVEIDGDPWLYASDLDQLCSAAPGGHGLCLSAYWPTLDAPPKDREPEARPLLIKLAQSLEFASSLEDRNTWFDAEDAFP